MAILTLSRGQRQVMHQLDNLCSLIRESSSEERSRLTRMGSSNSSSRDLSIESFLLSNAESSRLPLVQRRGCENNASLEASIVKDFDKLQLTQHMDSADSRLYCGSKASFKTKSGKRAAEINIRRKMSVDKQTEIVPNLTVMSSQHN
ncbi:hypothetical protein Bca52824_063896 [Brassica carinata]|uniref:Uncharacterized protein n=1 Tax=Brassica carinata TaxID=52824 RepID=A0A8X7U9M4_BRACI|nr:hypothetical protein Bca52824_063896 [Brassica carinata]